MDFWENVGVPFVIQQSGFRGNYIAFSEENIGKLRTFTLWDNKENFDQLYLSEGHDNMIKALKSTGMQIDDRDGLNVLIDSRPSSGILRVIKFRLKPDKTEDAVHYWNSTGEALISSQTGCIRAEAFKEKDSDYFVIAILWASNSDAERFITSEAHKEFATGMDTNVLEVIEKSISEKI